MFIDIEDLLDDVIWWIIVNKFRLVIKICLNIMNVNCWFNNNYVVNCVILMLYIVVVIIVLWLLILLKIMKFF